MNALAPQAALAAGMFGALGLGLMRRPPAGAVRAVAVAAPLAALWQLRSGAHDWQLAIFGGALPMALLSSGDDVEAALFLGSVLGMGLLATSRDLLMTFVGLEFMSLPAYLLVARAGDGDKAPRLEAAVKYFFSGALAGALFLLGLALYYAQTRGLGPTALPLGLRGQAGVALMASAALFKIGAVPLHWWLPDVYEAAAPEVSGFLSTSMKAAAVVFLMRIALLAPNPAFARLLPGIGAATALFGALLALRQRSLQRLLAYSSLSHAGLLILGVGAWLALGREDTTATAALLFYLFAYALMSNGAFAFLKASGARTRDDLRGYAARHPGPAAAFAVLLLALGGVPPTGGFVAKLLILWQALRAALTVPVLAAAAAAVISLGYYLGLVRDMYFEPAPAGGAAGGSPRARAVALACALGVLALGAAPFVLGGLTGSGWR